MSQEDCSLKMIFVLFRHGDRTPTASYPNDPHKNYFWSIGNESLTEKGKQQAYNLGVLLSKKYSKLLLKNNNCTTEDIYIQSSYVERCKKSAEHFLSGFLSNESNPQSIPIHSISMDKDHLIAQSRKCKKYDEELTKAKEENSKHYKEIFDYLSQQTDWEVRDVIKVQQLYNILEIQENAGLELPNWTKNVFPDKMLPLAEEGFALYTKTSFMKKVRGGAFLSEIVNLMNQKSSKNLKPDRKIFVYSGHDLTIVSVLNSLGVLDQASKRPDFASAVVFEFHKNKENVTEIKIFYYRNSEEKNPKEIHLSTAERCSLEKFKEILQPLLIENIDELFEN